MIIRSLILLASSALLIGCEQQPLLAVGQLESDRIELVAEYAEPIVSIQVTEGQMLQQGDIVLLQNTERVDLQLVEAQANVERLQGLLQEQLAGPIPERFAVIEASLHEATIEQDFRARDLQRLSSLRSQNLTSIESVDNAQRLLDTAAARTQNYRAQLAELRAGTRAEQIAQTRSQIQQAEARVAELHVNRSRLQVQAPVNAIVDSLPFEIGERPRQGDVVAVLLTGAQPHARLYIPESVRVDVQTGMKLGVHIDGVDGVVEGTVRRIAAEASFTPYFALTERDRGRLSYVAEVELPPQSTRLPEGVPVQVEF